VSHQKAAIDGAKKALNQCVIVAFYSLGTGVVVSVGECTHDISD